ncbi:uncharacterized protein EV422DRAFT_548025, partial [Fimicolochytrium jonesii]|uniref:uncharacterized protein n=1 Tax=Fimicolochytrium jonesii TaxID=1396493 RepID=UPI0022FEDD34
MSDSQHPAPNRLVVTGLRRLPTLPAELIDAIFLRCGISEAARLAIGLKREGLKKLVLPKLTLGWLWLREDPELLEWLWKYKVGGLVIEGAAIGGPFYNAIATLANWGRLETVREMYAVASCDIRRGLGPCLCTAVWQAARRERYDFVEWVYLLGHDRVDIDTLAAAEAILQAAGRACPELQNLTVHRELRCRRHARCEGKTRHEHRWEAFLKAARADNLQTVKWLHANAPRPWPAGYREAALSGGGRDRIYHWLRNEYIKGIDGPWVDGTFVNGIWVEQHASAPRPFRPPRSPPAQPKTTGRRRVGCCFFLNRP